tara:strand:+ start:699 stop:893 length:195 start_codon:yes stop_codon:yes gene_type:complete
MLRYIEVKNLRRSLMEITREMMKAWAENYEQAIDVLMWVANDGYDRDDLVEAIEIYFDIEWEEV